MFKRLVRFILRLFGVVAPEPPAEESTSPVEESPVIHTTSGAALKKAVLVGVNDCGIPGAELNGCVNDIGMGHDVFTMKIQIIARDGDAIRFLFVSLERCLHST